MNCEMQQKPPLLREGFRAGGAIDGKMGGEEKIYPSVVGIGV